MFTSHFAIKIMQWKWSKKSSTNWLTACGSSSYSFGSLLLYLALSGGVWAEPYAISSQEGGMVFTATQNLGQLWPLDQLVHLHIVVKHQELDFACDHIKQAEKHLRTRIEWEDLVAFIKLRKRLCHEAHKRSKRGAMQYIWHAIGSFLGLEDSPHQDNIGSENWHILQLNEDQLQQQLGRLYNQTKEHLEQVQSNLRRQTKAQLKLDHSERLSELRAIRLKLSQDVQLLRNGRLPEKWKDTLTSLIDKRFASDRKLKIDLEKHLQSWRDGKLPISTFWLPNARLEAVIHLPQSEAPQSRLLQKLNNIKVLPLLNGLPIIKGKKIKIWSAEINHVFSQQANTEVRIKEDKLRNDCLEINNEFFCPNLEIIAQPESCETSLLEGNVSKMIRLCDLVEVWQDHFAWNHQQNWTLVCATIQPMAKVCPHSSESLWCQPELQIFRLNASCHIKTPQFTLMGPPDGKSQVLQLESYVHQVQRSNFSNANVTNWDFLMSPLRHTMVTRRMEQQNQDTRWWLWILTFLVVGALILICSTLSGIGYCSFDNKRTS